MDAKTKSACRSLLAGQLYLPKCRCTGWYCQHDGFVAADIRACGLQPDGFGLTTEVSWCYWCPREDFIEALKVVHGEEEILGLLLELET